MYDVKWFFVCIFMIKYFCIVISTCEKSKPLYSHSQVDFLFPGFWYRGVYGMGG